ncbi:MAG: hypothetical protein IT368_01930 [Candidatus Hydrogenedentes bacterium]|nr:hypothetical protein [Candidatus Hydrogenedentota bacterium]
MSDSIQTSASPHPLVSLDLTENIHLVVQGVRIGIQDAREISSANDAHVLFRRNGDGAGLVALLWEILPGRRVEGRFDPIVEALLSYRTAAYGHKSLEGTARYSDGSEEDWRIVADTLAMRVEWVRQPHAYDIPLMFNLVTARQCCNLELWHTGRGRQIINGVMQAARDADVGELEAPDEAELLFYSIHPRNCLRAALPTGGRAAIRRSERQRPLEPDEPREDGDSAGKVAEPVWEVEWEGYPAAITYLYLSCGVRAAASHFDGRHRLYTCDASPDFGPFFHQAVLSALPLNIVDSREHVEIRPHVLTADNQAQRPVELRELAWASEFLYLLEPQFATRMIRETIERHLPSGRHEDPCWPSGLADNSVAELLMMAGRYFALTEDVAFATQYLESWRACGKYLLSLRRPHEALPVSYNSWHPGTALAGKDPYLSAVCYAAFVRLGFIEGVLKNRSQAYFWQSEAENLREGALAPYQYGGLWNAEHNVFISGVDFRESAQAGEFGNNPLTGVPQTGFALYQNVIPFWLGLAEGPQIVQGYKWIDGRWNYASGRAGLSYPPQICGNFLALLDVCVRQRHGVPGADRLLQLILDHAYDGGLPFPEAPYGRYDLSHPNAFGVPHPNWKHLPSGAFLANAVFLGLVLNIHYGLEYSKRGWYLGNPSPLETYPLSRVTWLRHERATYAVTWQGRGKIRRVRLDGKVVRTQWLDLVEGQHEVVVELA